MWADIFNTTCSSKKSGAPEAVCKILGANLYNMIPDWN